MPRMPISRISAKVTFCGRSGMPDDRADLRRREAARYWVGDPGSQTLTVACQNIWWVEDWLQIFVRLIEYQPQCESDHDDRDHGLG